MTCLECADALMLLADRDAGLRLDAAELRQARAAEAHTADCAACRRELALTREVTARFSALPSPEPSTAFDARVLAAFFAEAAAHAPVRVARPPWMRRLAVGYAAGWATAAAAIAVWMLAGGWQVAIQSAAAVTGPTVSTIALATQRSVEFLASLVVALQLADRVMAIVLPAMVAVARALQPGLPLTMFLVSLAGAAGVLALMLHMPRVSRRRTRHVHAILWTA